MSKPNSSAIIRAESLVSRWHGSPHAGIRLEDQRLIHNGVQLTDTDGTSATLTSMGISNDSTVHLLLRLRGGGDAMKVHPSKSLLV